MLTGVEYISSMGRKLATALMNAPRDETGHVISDSKITFLIEKMLGMVPLFKVMDADDRSMLVRPCSFAPCSLRLAPCCSGSQLGHLRARADM